ncbi:MAG: hypothetical protein WA749_04895 [Gelidibacter sp.]
MTENNNLGDDLKRTFDDTSDHAKQRAHEFTEGAKQAAHEFENDVNQVSKDGKNIALIAHLTLIGWIIAFVMNNNTKSGFGSFYIRQVLGLGLCGLVLSFIPVLGWIVSLGIFVLWIMSLIGALNGEKKLTPVLGIHFQEWFKSL